jgi:hypothetical protein
VINLLSITIEKHLGIIGEKKIMRTNKIAFVLLTMLLVLSFILSGCATATPTATQAPVVTEAPAVTEAPTTGTSVKNIPQSLIDACKQEGMVTIIATPGWWANYQEIFDTFTSLTGAQLNSLDENAQQMNWLPLKIIKATPAHRLPTSWTSVMPMVRLE